MPVAPFHIRRLGPGDITALRRLNTLFARAFADPDTYGSEPPDDAYLTRLLAKDTVMVLVASAGDSILGGLVAYELEKLEKARSEIYIYDLAVDAAHRRRGIATALIAHLGEIATERGAWVIFVQADYGDDPAVALYTKLGTREEVMHFDIVPQPARRRL